MGEGLGFKLMPLSTSITIICAVRHVWESGILGFLRKNSSLDIWVIHKAHHHISSAKCPILGRGVYHKAQAKSSVWVRHHCHGFIYAVISDWFSRPRISLIIWGRGAKYMDTQISLRYGIMMNLRTVSKRTYQRADSSALVFMRDNGRSIENTKFSCSVPLSWSSF